MYTVRAMRTYSLAMILCFALLAAGCQSPPEEEPKPEPAPARAEQQAEPAKSKRDPIAVDGCSPQFTAISDTAVVTFQGEGDLDITVITDPLCWHCRLGHKLLNENPELYGTVRLAFFPRRSFIGSDMAAWILEDAADRDNLKEIIDFAYKNLKQPKTEDLAEARDLILTQFLFQFPDLLGENETLEEYAARLNEVQRPHVAETAELCRAAELPGTPTLLAGKYILMGYGAGPWIKALSEKKFCE